MYCVVVRVLRVCGALVYVCSDWFECVALMRLCVVRVLVLCVCCVIVWWLCVFRCVDCFELRLV